MPRVLPTLAGAALLAALVVALAPASAQESGEEDPTLNESDFDTSVPEDDRSYLNNETEDAPASGEGQSSTGGDTAQPEDEGGATTSGDDPSLDESDFDTSVPEGDSSWLNDDVPSEGAPATGAGSNAAAPQGDERDVPALPALGFAAALAAAARLRRRPS